MNLLENVNEVAASSEIIVFGIPLSDFISIIVAITAIIGILISMSFSRKSLKQAEVLSLLDRRTAILDYFINFFAEKYYEKPEGTDRNTLLLNSANLEIYFGKSNPLSDLLYELLKTYKNDSPLPDYTDRYKGLLVSDGETTPINTAFRFYALDCINELQQQLSCIKIKKSKKSKGSKKRKKSKKGKK